MIRRKLGRRKNPNEYTKYRDYAESIVNEKLELLGAGEGGEVYKFGNKIIKIFRWHMSNSTMKYLLTLSDLKLIPEIHEIAPRFMIQSYVKGKTLKELLSEKISKTEAAQLLNKISKHIQVWHNAGFGHGDLENTRNIIITSTGKIIFIDPFINTGKHDWMKMDREALLFIEDELIENMELR